MSNKKKKNKTKVDLFTPLLKGSFPDHNAVKSVLNGFKDCHSDDEHDHRSLKFTVEFTNPAHLLGAIKEAIPDGYNSFNVERVASILEILFTCGEDLNLPESEFQSPYTFRFGREGSPVLYIRSTRRFWLDEVNKIQQTGRVDECSFEASGELRLWWD